MPVVSRSCIFLRDIESDSARTRAQARVKSNAISTGKYDIRPPVGIVSTVRQPLCMGEAAVVGRGQHAFLMANLPAFRARVSGRAGL